MSVIVGQDADGRFTCDTDAQPKGAVAQFRMNDEVVAALSPWRLPGESWGQCAKRLSLQHARVLAGGSAGLANDEVQAGSKPVDLCSHGVEHIWCTLTE